MIKEAEPKKFRAGESTGRPLGGNVVGDPFAQALYSLAKSRGYESQLKLSRVLGRKSNSTVQKWYSTRTKPNVEFFSALIRLLKPNETEMEKLAGPWAESLQENHANRSRKLLEKWKKSSPVKRFLVEWMESRNTSIMQLAVLIGKAQKSFYSDDKLSINTISKILENGPIALELDDSEQVELRESVAEEISSRLAQGEKIEGVKDTSLANKLKSTVDCTMYTPIEAARELNISRERIRQLRKKYDLPLLITEDQLENLKNRPVPDRSKKTPAQVQKEIREIKVEYLLKIDPKLTNRDIAKIIGVSEHMVVRDINKLISEKRLLPKGEMFREKIRELRELGKTNREIRDQLKLTQPRLYYHMGKIRRTSDRYFMSDGELMRKM